MSYVATLIRPGYRFKNLGIALIIIGLVIFSCHRCFRLAAPEAVESAYPNCDELPDLILNKSSQTIILRNDCWSRGINVTNNQTIYEYPTPNNAKFAVKCANSAVKYLPVDYIYQCNRPVRYKSISEPTMNLTLTDLK
jgi:hypothetical protein